MDTTEIKNEIYTQLSEEISSDEKVSKIYSKVEDLENFYIDDRKQTGKQLITLRDEITKLGNEFADTTQKYEKQLYDERKAIRNIFTIRQFLLSLFCISYDTHHTQIEHLPFQKYAENTEILRKKELSTEKGVKFALATLHHKEFGISKDLARYYLKINSQSHPPIKPPSVILDSIQNLKIIKEKHPYYSPFDINLNTEILDEIERLVPS